MYLVDVLQVTKRNNHLSQVTQASHSADHKLTVKYLSNRTTELTYDVIKISESAVPDCRYPVILLNYTLSKK